MTTGLKTKQAGNADLDAVFDPYVQGTSPPATGFNVGGTTTDINTRYAPIIYGTAAAVTGLQTKQSGHADLNTLFAAYGTASYGLPFDGETYLETYSIPLGGTGYAGVGFRLTSSSAWQIYGYNPTVPTNSFLTGAVPSGAIKCSATFGTVTTPGGSTSAGGTTSTNMASATALSTGLFGDLQSSTAGAASGTRRSQVDVTITFYNSGGTAISVSTCTFVVETDGSV